MKHKGNVEIDGKLYVEDKEITKTYPIIFSATAPTTESDGSPLVVGASRWCDTNDYTLYHWVEENGNTFWITL